MTQPQGFGLYIKRINDWLDCEANRSLQAQNLTRSQSHLLMTLRHLPEKCASLKELESRLGAAQSTVAGLALRLEKKGLIRSLPDPDDRRVKRVCLTAAGDEMCDASLRDIALTEEHLVSGLTDCEQTLLLNLLQRMQRAASRENHI